MRRLEPKKSGKEDNGKVIEEPDQDEGMNQNEKTPKEKEGQGGRQEPSREDTQGKGRT